MKKIKISLSVLTAFLILSFVGVQAQNPQPQKVDSITNKELKKVAVTLQKARTIQRQAAQKLREAVRETDLSFSRYQTIIRSKKNPNKDTVEVTEEEKKALNKVRPKLNKINRQSKKKFQKTLKKHDLTQQRLRQIMLVLRSNPDVAKRFQKIMAKQKNNKKQ